MKILTIGFMAVAVLASVGCKKKDGGAAKETGSGDTTTTTPKPADPPKPAEPAAKGTCVDGAWKAPSNTYCVKVPQGFTPPATPSPKNDGRIRDQFDTDGNNTFIVTVYEKTMSFDDAKSSISSEGNGSKIVDKGDFEGGGYFVKHRNDTDKVGGLDGGAVRRQRHRL